MDFQRGQRLGVAKRATRWRFKWTAVCPSRPTDFRLSKKSIQKSMKKIIKKTINKIIKKTIKKTIWKIIKKSIKKVIKKSIKKVIKKRIKNIIKKMISVAPRAKWSDLKGGTPKMVGFEVRNAKTRRPMMTIRRVCMTIG